eukprot:391248-Pelagomonas_calceolata.AAC.1
MSSMIAVKSERVVYEGKQLRLPLHCVNPGTVAWRPHHHMCDNRTLLRLSTMPNHPVCFGQRLTCHRPPQNHTAARHEPAMPKPQPATGQTFCRMNLSEREPET